MQLKHLERLALVAVVLSPPSRKPRTALHLYRACDEREAVLTGDVEVLEVDAARQHVEQRGVGDE